MQEFSKDFILFLKELFKFIKITLHVNFLRFDSVQNTYVTKLYKQRGKQSKRLVHLGMTALAAIGILIGPHIAKEFPGRSIDPWSITAPPEVLSASTESGSISTNISSFREGIVDYVVQEGDTVSSIADKFGISANTIIWQNDLPSGDAIKVGETLEILPVTGIAHKVEKGDTVESIAKKYGLPSSEAVVEFPFNSFVNDETFALAIGQTVIVPNGVRVSSGVSYPAIAVQITPNAGTVVANGSFVWPTAGLITQGYYWYHPGIDIANPAAPNILAADAGTIVAIGWDTTGYGNRIIIDHGNGMQTLYAHMSAFYVTLGQTVTRGAAIGRMGSTGHSTGTHLHFEIHQNGIHLNPLNYLK